MGKNTQIEKETLKQFFRLKQDLAREDVFIELDSAYHSIKKQEELMAKFEHEYGFEYSKGKEKITGYSYEPWHIRYVGIPKIASYLTSQNLTLEEYKEQTK